MMACRFDLLGNL